MILTPGQLYFINKQDIKLVSVLNYYKIGIVGRRLSVNLKNYTLGIERSAKYFAV
jgi:hypothetical protein